MFIEKPANNLSLSARKLIEGVGINDSPYITGYKENGKWHRCPFYTTWKSMIVRCYSSKYHEKFPTYKECSVTEKWHTFTEFRSWMEKQNWKHRHLDKDLLLSKQYSPEFCIFVPASVNGLITDNKCKRGELPKGVSLKKDTGKFVAQCCINGRSKNLGHYSSPSEAEDVYIKFKSEHIRNIAEKYRDEKRLYFTLINYANHVRQV